MKKLMSKNFIKGKKTLEEISPGAMLYSKEIAYNHDIQHDQVSEKQEF